MCTRSHKKIKNQSSYHDNIAFRMGEKQKKVCNEINNILHYIYAL